MAAQPLTRQMFERIEEAGGEDLVFPLLAEGKTVTEVARILNEEYTGYGLGSMSRGMLSTWCNKKERKERYLEARRLGAAMFAEDSMHIVDDCPPEKGHVQKAKLRSDTRRWIAGKLDHDAWGTKDKGSVQLNVNNLHLEAVRAMGTDEGRRLERAGDEGDILEGEILSGDSPEDFDSGDDWLE